MTDQRQSYSHESFGNRARWKNTSGETVPAYGVVQVDEYDTDDKYWKVVKPTNVGDMFFVNGRIPVEDDAESSSLPLTVPQECLIDYGGVSPDALVSGVGVSPVPGEWAMGPGTLCSLLTNDSDAGTGWVMLTDNRRHRGILSGLLSATEYSGTTYLATSPATAECKLLYTKTDGTLDYDRDSVGTIRTVTVSNFLAGIAFEGGMMVRIEQMNGVWECYVVDCPA